MTARNKDFELVQHWVRERYGEAIKNGTLDPELGKAVKTILSVRTRKRNKVFRPATSAVLDDPLIRQALRESLPRDALVIEELGILQGDARIDLAVVTDRLHGYEIKSDFDSLQRLPKQARHYSAVFDYVTLITTNAHLSSAEGMIPEWWGIEVAHPRPLDGPRLLQRRPARPNPAVDPRALVELLWRDDAAAFLGQRDTSIRHRHWTRARLWDRICEVYSLEEIRAAVIERLRHRAAEDLA